MPLRRENQEPVKTVSVRRLNVPEDETPKRSRKSLSKKKADDQPASSDGQSADTTEEK